MSQFLPRKHIQDRLRLWSSVRCPLPGSENSGCVSIQWTEFTVCTFAEMTDVSGWGVSYSLGKIDGISRRPVWLGVPFPWTEFVLQCKVWWMLGEELVFAFYFDNQVDGEMTVGGVNSSYSTGVFVYSNLESTSYWQVDRGMKLNGAAVEARLTLESISLLDPPRTWCQLLLCWICRPPSCPAKSSPSTALSCTPSARPSTCPLTRIFCRQLGWNFPFQLMTRDTRFQILRKSRCLFHTTNVRNLSSRLKVCLSTSLLKFCVSVCTTTMCGVAWSTWHTRVCR